MRWLRWTMLLAVLAACAYLVVGVEFSGRTLLERLRGTPPQGPTEPAATASGAAAAPATSPGASDPQPGPGSDDLTDEDRAGLDRLIESKLDHGTRPPAQPAEPRRPGARPPAQP